MPILNKASTGSGGIPINGTDITAPYTSSYHSQQGILNCQAPVTGGVCYQQYKHYAKTTQWVALDENHAFMADMSDNEYLCTRIATFDDSKPVTDSVTLTDIITQTQSESGQLYSSVNVVYLKDLGYVIVGSYRYIWYFKIENNHVVANGQCTIKGTYVNKTKSQFFNITGASNAFIHYNSYSSGNTTTYYYFDIDIWLFDPNTLTVTSKRISLTPIGKGNGSQDESAACDKIGTEILDNGYKDNFAYAQIQIGKSGVGTSLYVKTFSLLNTATSNMVTLDDLTVMSDLENLNSYTVITLDGYINYYTNIGINNATVSMIGYDSTVSKYYLYTYDFGLGAGGKVICKPSSVYKLTNFKSGTSNNKWVYLAYNNFLFVHFSYDYSNSYYVYDLDTETNYEIVTGLGSNVDNMAAGHYLLRGNRLYEFTCDGTTSYTRIIGYDFSIIINPYKDFNKTVGYIQSYDSINNTATMTIPE